MWPELGNWLKMERSLASGLSTVVTPTWSHDHVSLRQSVWLHNTRSLAHHWQTYLPSRLTCLTPHGRQYFSNKPNPCVGQSGTWGSTIEKPAETQISIQLARHLVRALTPDLEDMSSNPNSNWLKVEISLGSVFLHYNTFLHNLKNSEIYKVVLTCLTGNTYLRTWTNFEKHNGAGIMNQ